MYKVNSNRSMYLWHGTMEYWLGRKTQTTVKYKHCTCFQEVSLCAPSSFTTVNATKAYGSTERSFRYKRHMELTASRFVFLSENTICINCNNFRTDETSLNPSRTWIADLFPMYNSFYACFFIIIIRFLDFIYIQNTTRVFFFSKTWFQCFFPILSKIAILWTTQNVLFVKTPPTILICLLVLPIHSCLCFFLIFV